MFHILYRLIYRKIQKLTAVHHLLSSELKKNKDIHDLLFDNVNVNLEKLNHKNVWVIELLYGVLFQSILIFDVHSRYSFNQISIEYLSLCCQKNLNETPENKEESKYPLSIPSLFWMIFVPFFFILNTWFKIAGLNQLYQERIEIFQKMGIDVNSCVYFLMDFYSRWLLKPVIILYLLFLLVHSKKLT